MSSIGGLEIPQSVEERTSSCLLVNAWEVAADVEGSAGGGVP